MSAIGQGDELFNSQLFSCIIDGLHWEDLYFICNLIIFCLLIRECRNINKPIIKMFVILVVAICIDFLAYVGYCFQTPERRSLSYVLQCIDNRQFSSFSHLCNPNDTCFRRGCVRSLLHEAILDFQEEIDNTKNGISKISILDSKMNIIFILVESYMSFVSDMKYNNNEITPFLNSLKRDSNVYYNGLMRENVTIGESSDGQFIYMTGLLPLRSIITVSKARNITLPGLPYALKKNSQMVIPTIASLWNQNEMCHKYGINQLYTSDDFMKGVFPQLNDDQIFQFAIQQDSSLSQPFFSIILTMSMHQPYTMQIDSSFPIDDSTISKDLACYLNVCHYTDNQIRKYFEHLKQIGLYDNRLIIIAADHPVHNTDFGGVSKHIPFYLVNVPEDVLKKLWGGECNQIDVYPTLLDLLGIESDWYGLGCSLLSSDYSNLIPLKKWDVSEWIIRGDYFSN